MSEFISDSVYMARPKRGNNMVNVKMVLRVLGVLLLVEVCMFLLCALVSWGYGEAEVMDFLLTAGITALAGGLLLLLGRGAERRLNSRDGYVIASMVWLLFTLFGMLPFYLTGSVESIANAFFETMSGFTTTGATIMDNIDQQSHGILFWRAFTHWIGGLGIVCFVIAVLPIFNEGNVQLFSAESVGVGQNRIHPKISMMAKWIWTVYLLLTVAETVLLYVGGMGWFDAVCHAFSTTSTGGFSTKQAGVGYWNSAYIEYVVAIFMLLSGVNFSLYFLCLKGKAMKMLRDEELRWYLWSVGLVTVFVTAALFFADYYDLEESFRKAFFQVVTIHTSCGLTTDDYNLWPPFTWLLLIYVMVSGGCTGSTSGGVKSIRLLIVAKGVRNCFKRILHPNAVLPVRVNNQTVAPNTIIAVAVFVCFFLFCFLVGWVILMMQGVGFLESFSTVMASLANAGVALGDCGPAYSWNSLPDGSKWVLSFLMLLGRLEMYCVLLLFYPPFWKKG